MCNYNGRPFPPFQYFPANSPQGGIIPYPGIIRAASVCVVRLILPPAYMENPKKQKVAGPVGDIGYFGILLFHGGFKLHPQGSGNVDFDLYLPNIRASIS